MTGKDCMRQTALAAALVVLSLPAFAVDPQLMKLVMPDAKIVTGMNVTSAKVSPFGEFLFARKDLLSEGLWKFIGLSGFDLSQDVSEVLTATASSDVTRINDLVLTSGTFNVDKIVAACKAAGAEITVYRGQTLLSIADSTSKVVSAVAFLGSSIAISGEFGAVKAAIDRRGASTPAFDQALALQANQLSEAEDVWLALSYSPSVHRKAAEPDGKPLDPAAQLGALLKKYTFSCGIRFGAEVQFTGRAVSDDPPTVATMYAIFKLLSGFGPMARIDPQFAKYSDLMQVLQAAQIATVGPEVSIRLSMPQAQSEVVFDAVWRNMMAKGTAPAVAAPPKDDSKGK
jgi:hypothetical protein